MTEEQIIMQEIADQESAAEYDRYGNDIVSGQRIA